MIVKQHEPAQLSSGQHHRSRQRFTRRHIPVARLTGVLRISEEGEGGGAAAPSTTTTSV